MPLLIDLLAFLPLAIAAPDPSWVSARDALVLDAGDSKLRGWEVSDDWRQRVLAMDVRAWQNDRATAMLAWSAAPSAYRGALFRFGDPRLHTPAAAGPLLARLAWGGDGEPVRIALAEAIVHTGGDWAEAVILMLPDEQSVAVRKVLVEDGRVAPPPFAAALVAAGFADEATSVRAAAARTAPWVTPTSAVAPRLLAALSDADADVRSEAARSVGLLDVEGAWRPLVSLLADSDARVRLQALKALQRLDAVNAATLPQMESLRNDTDGRVQRAAAGGSGSSGE